MHGFKDSAYGKCLSDAHQDTAGYKQGHLAVPVGQFTRPFTSGTSHLTPVRRRTGYSWQLRQGKVDWNECSWAIQSNSSGVWSNKGETVPDRARRAKIRSWAQCCWNSQEWLGKTGIEERDGDLGIKDQPRSETTNTLALMLIHSIWVARNKTVHREGLCHREGAVAIRILFHYYGVLKSFIKLDFRTAKIKNKLTEFQNSGLACAKPQTAITCIFYFKNLQKILKSNKRLL